LVRGGGATRRNGRGHEGNAYHEEDAQGVEPWDWRLTDKSESAEKLRAGAAPSALPTSAILTPERIKSFTILGRYAPRAKNEGGNSKGDG